MKKKFKRCIASLLIFTMFFTVFPVTVFADDRTEEQIRQRLLASVDSAVYSDGVIDFLTPRMETSEDLEYVEFAIVRRGNTDAEAGVTFKAIDVSAKYGEDYLIKVPKTIFSDTLSTDPGSKSFVELNSAAGEENAIILSEDKKNSVAESVYELKREEQPVLPEYEVQYEELKDDTVVNNVYQATGLQYARTVLTGAPSDNRNWTEVDDKTKAKLAAAYNSTYEDLPGAQYTFTFAPGEYMKKLRFYTIDDNISEDEEQVLFALINPVGGKLTDNPTGYMNIIDNEEKEPLGFEIKENLVTVDKESDYAVVTVQRTTGLNRYGTAEIGSASQSAQAGIYYDAFYEEIPFVPGQEYKTIKVPIKKHPISEDVSFMVKLGDNSDNTTVRIKGTDATDDEQRMALMSGGFSLMAAPDRWTRSAKILSGEKEFKLSNKKNSNSYQNYNVDLSMVGKISFDSKSYSNGTFWESGMWWWYESGYYRDYATFLKLGDINKGDKWHKEGKYDDWRDNDTVTLDDNERKNNKIVAGVRTWGNTKHAEAKFRDITVHYLPIEVRLEDPLSTDNDCYITTKEWTSPTNYTEKNKYLAGKLAFDTGGEALSSGSGTMKFFYNDDTVNLKPEYDSALPKVVKDNIYLWGFKIERIGGSASKYYYVEGTSFKIKDLFTGKLKDFTGKKIDVTTTRMTDGDFYCFKLYPVYQQKMAYTKITLDGNKSTFATGTFSNNQTMAVGMLDSIKYKITQTATGKDYVVCGFDYYAQTSPAKEKDLWRETYDNGTTPGDNRIKNNSPYYKKNSNWPVKTVLAISESTPGEFIFSPVESAVEGEKARNENHLVAIYTKPDIEVTVHPAATNHQDQGKATIVYDDQSAKFTGVVNGLNKGTSISIMPYTANDLYQFVSIYKNDQDEDNYRVLWSDMTGDINKNGNYEKEEKTALGSKYQAIERNSFVGNLFNYLPTFTGSRKLYYSIEPRPSNESGTALPVSGNIYLKSRPVMSNVASSAYFEKVPIEGVQVVIGGHTALTDEEGYFNIESSDFRIGETYSAVINYGGRDYTGWAVVNYPMDNIDIDEYDTFNVRDFKAQEVYNASDYENKDDWKTRNISLFSVPNNDARHLYTFAIDELSEYTVGKVEVKRYSSSGTLKKTYTAVYNEKTNLYEVKDPELLKDADFLANNTYNYSINPASDGVLARDYLTITVYDQHGRGYIEHEVGFKYIKALNAINLINSFKSPFNGAIEFIGQADTEFDLGMSAKLDSLVEENGEIEYSNDAEGNRVRTIKIGFSKDFQGSYDSSESEDEDAGDQQGEGEQKDEGKDEEKTEGEILKEAAKESDEKTEDNSENKDDAASETAKAAVDENGEDNQRSSKVVADFNFNMSIAFVLTMVEDKERNEFYFKDFVITGVLAGGASTKVEILTPIGITVFMNLSISGDITALMVIEQYNGKKFYFDAAGTDEDRKIDLSNAGRSDVNRDFDIYGKLMINPEISLEVGAGVGSSSVASASVKGNAKFDMAFTTAGSGNGKVRLSGEFILSFLGGTIEKKWYLGDYSYNMFDINGGGAQPQALSLFQNEDFRYDTISTKDKGSRDYLKNSSAWQGNTASKKNRMSLLAVGAEGRNDHILKEGVFPYAYPIIDYIDDDKQLMVFLDDNTERSFENKTTLMYSIYKNGAWSEPLPVDDDGTNDDDPLMYNLGNGKMLVTWSDANRIFTGDEDATDMLNARNIIGRFFDTDTMTFGEVMEITKETDADKFADDSASFAYCEKDGKEYLMISYSKTDYQNTNTESDDPRVGDLINPYSTVAYRLYDFENKKWVDTYDEKTLAEIRDRYDYTNEELEKFTQDWYGQYFVDLSEYVTVDESKILNEEGKWSASPEPSDISLTSIVGPDPRILENESIGFDGYMVFSYVVDLDGDLSTIYDKEIFLQVYECEDEIFYPAIRLTNDDVPQSYNILESTDEEVILGYISDGDIVEFGLDSLIGDNKLVTTANDGSEVMLINKDYRVYSAPTTIYDAPEDHPLTEYILLPEGNDIYVQWSEYRQTYREGIDPASEEATLPENYFKEHQLYIMKKSGEYFETTLCDENGVPYTYPANDKDSNPIDYNTVPDINSEVGIVKAGDEIVQKGYAYSWSKPVALTEEQGANFTDIDFVVLEDNLIRCVALKGMSKVMEIDGKRLPMEDINDRSLITRDFDLNYENYTLSFGDLSGIQSGVQQMPVYVEVKNESVIKRENVLVSLYQIIGADETLVGEINIESLGGGDTATVMIPWDVPENIDDVKLTAKVSHGGSINPDWSATHTFTYESMVNITSAEAVLTGRNSADVNVRLINHGHESVNNKTVSVLCSGETYVSDNFSLPAGASITIPVNIEIPETAFVSAADEGGNRTETAVIKVSIDNDIDDCFVKRYASANLVAAAENIKDITFRDYDTSYEINNGVSIKVGRLLELDYMAAFYNEEGAARPRVEFESDNEHVVTVTNGVIKGIGRGSANITAYIMPQGSSYSTMGDSFVAVDNYHTLPASLIKTVTIPVRVGFGHSGSPGSNKPGTEMDENTESTEETPQPGEALSFRDVSTSDWYYDSVKFAVEQGLFSGTGENSFAPRSTLTRGMIVTVLARLHQADVSQYGDSKFKDVDLNKWYGSSAAWASANNIIKGMSDTEFAPNVPVTREQLAVMLTNYAKLIGMETENDTDLTNYQDSGNVSEWGVSAMKWAVSLGLINGRDDGTLDPKGTATRAEAAAIFQRFLSL